MPHQMLGKDKWDRLRQLHAEGLGRNAIAREIGCNPSCISRTAHYLGLTFDRTSTQEATAARLADLEERRVDLAIQFHDIAEESLERLYEPTTVFSFGGKDNNYNEHTFDEAPVAERQKLVTAAAIAVDKSLKLAPPAAGSDLAGAKSMLGSLGEALTRYSQDKDDTEGDEA